MLPQLRSRLKSSGVKRSTFAPGENTAPKSKLSGKTPTIVDGRAVQFDGLAHDSWIGVELTPPVGVGQQSHCVGPAPSLVWSVQPAHGGLHAENLEEVADDLDASGRLRLAASGEAKIVRSGEGLYPLTS